MLVHAGLSGFGQTPFDSIIARLIKPAPLPLSPSGVLMPSETVAVASQPAAASPLTADEQKTVTLLATTPVSEREKLLEGKKFVVSPKAGGGFLPKKFSPPPVPAVRPPEDGQTAPGSPGTSAAPLLLSALAFFLFKEKA